MIQLLKNIFSGPNEFASGGLLLMLFGGLGVYLHAIPGRVWDWWVDQVTMSITLKDEDAGFVWLKEWFREQEFLKRVRRLDFDTTVRAEGVALISAPRPPLVLSGGAKAPPLLGVVYPGDIPINGGLACTGGQVRSALRAPPTRLWGCGGGG